MDKKLIITIVFLLTISLVSAVDITIDYPAGGESFSNEEAYVNWTTTGETSFSTITVEYYNGTDWNEKIRTKGQVNVQNLGNPGLDIYEEDTETIYVNDSWIQFTTDTGIVGLRASRINLTDGKPLASVPTYAAAMTEGNNHADITFMENFSGDGLPVAFTSRAAGRCWIRVFKYNSTADTWDRRLDLDNGIETGIQGPWDNTNKGCRIEAVRNMSGNNEWELFVFQGAQGYSYAMVYNESSNTWVDTPALVEGLNRTILIGETGASMITSTLGIGVDNEPDIFGYDYVLSGADAFNDVDVGAYYWDGDEWIRNDYATNQLYGQLDYLEFLPITEAYRLFQGDWSDDRIHYKGTDNYTPYTVIDLSNEPRNNAGKIRVKATDNTSTTSWVESSTFEVNFVEATCDEATDGTIIICHSKNTLEISYNAEAAHIAHGDTCGVCTSNNNAVVMAHNRAVLNSQALKASAEEEQGVDKQKAFIFLLIMAVVIYMGNKKK